MEKQEIFDEIAVNFGGKEKELLEGLVDDVEGAIEKKKWYIFRRVIVWYNESYYWGFILWKGRKDFPVVVDFVKSVKGSAKVHWREFADVIGKQKEGASYMRGLVIWGAGQLKDVCKFVEDIQDSAKFSWERCSRVVGKASHRHGVSLKGAKKDEVYSRGLVMWKEKGLKNALTLLREANSLNITEEAKIYLLYWMTHPGIKEVALGDLGRTGMRNGREILEKFEKVYPVAEEYWKDDNDVTVECLVRRVLVAILHNLKYVTELRKYDPKILKLCDGGIIALYGFFVNRKKELAEIFAES